MVTVTVSSKFQVVIPKEIREILKIKKGQKFQLIPFQNRIEFIPVRDVRELRGIAKGINTDIEREGDRL